MKVLVIGLGSMGKRRIRNLKAIGVEDIVGVDTREDRRVEVQGTYSIPTTHTLRGAAELFKPDAIIVSTPPDKHFDSAVFAVEHRIPCFVEASVISSDVAKLLEYCDGGSLIAPSCTMRYFSGPKKIKEVVGDIGKPLNLVYQVGQYLPDWHPYEDIKDFYVSKRETGACREIVPFELTWLNDIFGDPEPLACAKAKVGDLPADIDDTYHCVLNYPGMLASVNIEVLSRPTATRELRVVGASGILTWSSETNFVRHWSNPNDVRHSYVEHLNYDDPYIDEMRDFLAAVRNEKPWQNTLADDYKILRILDQLESLA